MSHRPPLARGHALRDVLCTFTDFLIKWVWSCRDRDVCDYNVGEFVCFFLNLRQARVPMNLNARSWDCAFVEKVKLDKSFVDLLLRYIVL
jgi:hypothetical protein